MFRSQREIHSAHPNIPTAALTTEEKGAFLDLGYWEAVGGRWYPQKDRHPQLPEAEGELV